MLISELVSVLVAALLSTILACNAGNVYHDLCSYAALSQLCPLRFPDLNIHWQDLPGHCICSRGAFTPLCRCLQLARGIYGSNWLLMERQ